MAQVIFDMIKIDGGDTRLLSSPDAQLWKDERETILARIGTPKGTPEVGLVLYAVSYVSQKEWIIRRIEVIAAMDGRPRSNITISIKVPAGFQNKGQKILGIFDAIHNDAKRKFSSPSEELLKKLEINDINFTLTQAPQNGKFGVKTFANDEELLRLLDNLLQKEYQNYQEVYFLPRSCKFYEDNTFIRLKDSIDKVISKRFEPQTLAEGITFEPNLSNTTISIFESDRNSKTIEWKCKGYKTIIKPFDDTQIYIDEIYREIKKEEYFAIKPFDASISCIIGGKKINEENGCFYIPIGKEKDCKFLITKVGYEQQGVSLLGNKQVIELKEKTNDISLPLYSHEGKSRVSITIRPSEFSNNSYSDLILCEKEYFNSIKEAGIFSIKKLFHTRKSVVIIFIIFLAGLVLGYGMSYVIPQSSATNEEVITIPATNSGEEGKSELSVSTSDQRTSVSNDTTPLTPEDSITNYLQQDTWNEERIITMSGAVEPRGLWRAMNTYDYETINGRYDLYKSNLVQKSLGKLEDVHNVIDSLSIAKGGITKIKKPKTPNGSRVDFCVQENSDCIIVSKWLEKVRAANGQQEQVTTKYKCHYCNQVFTTEQIRREHEENCPDKGNIND